MSNSAAARKHSSNPLSFERYVVDGVCTCRCCTLDKEAHAFANVHSVPMPEVDYEPIDLLGCKDFQRIGPERCWSKKEFDWWNLHAPHALAWLSEKALSESDINMEVAQYAVDWLIGRPTWPRENLCAKKEAFCWRDLSGHELFFEGLATSGLLKGFPVELVVNYSRRFARHLTAAGVIEQCVGEALDLEFAVWGPRVVAFFDSDGPWYREDGATVGYEGNLRIVTLPNGTIERHRMGGRGHRTEAPVQCPKPASVPASISFTKARKSRKRAKGKSRER